MRYLLDTHALVWALISTDKLSKDVKEILTNTQNEVFVSIISIWEISLKFSIGKLELVGKEPDEIPGAILDMNFKILDLEAGSAATFYKLPRYNKDPFDRMLAWQAINGVLVFLSKDKGFDDYKKLGLRRVW